MISSPRFGIRWREGDPLLLLAVVMLAAFGVVLVASATWRYYDEPSLLGNSWFLKQSAFVVAGLVAMGVCALVHPGLLRATAYPIYAVSLVALLAVLLVGSGAEEYGARRWIVLGGVPVQPSEPAKIALLMALARALDAPPGLRSFVLSAFLTALPAFLIYLEPDLGTALTFVMMWLGMLVLSGAPWRYVAGVVGLGVAATPLLWFAMKDYMRDRVLIFLDPTADALGQGYNILQAQISIGSGGLWGKGLLEGTQTQLRYLRVSHSDFIFSVLGEEMGFVGAGVLLLALGILLFRVLRAYERAETRFGSLLCAGLATSLGFQALANIGSNVGLLPVVGIPLPLVSYGGSALVSQMAGLGLVQSVLLRRKRYRFEA